MGLGPYCRNSKRQSGVAFTLQKQTQFVKRIRHSVIIMSSLITDLGRDPYTAEMTHVAHTGSTSNEIYPYGGRLFFKESEITPIKGIYTTSLLCHARKHAHPYIIIVLSAIHGLS